MNSLQERIEAGKQLALLKIQDTGPEIGWFLAAAQVDYDSTTGEPSCFSVHAACHSSFLFFSQPGSFGDPSVLGIADYLLDWIEGSLEWGWLTSEDPPTSQGPCSSHARIWDLMQQSLSELRQ